MNESAPAPDASRCARFRWRRAVPFVLTALCWPMAAWAQESATPSTDGARDSGSPDEAPEAGDPQQEASEAEGSDGGAPLPPVPPPVGEEEEEEGEGTAEPQGADEEPSESAATGGGASAQLSVAASGDAEPSFKLHAVVAGAKAISGYQAQEFGFGVAGLAALEWGPSPVWGLQAETGFVYLAGTGREPPTGLAELEGGAGALLAAGLRVRPFASSDFAPHPGGPWLSGAVGAALTGGGVAPVFDAFLGYDFLLQQNASIGPTLGYMHIVQTDKTGPRTDDASILLLGIHGTFDFGVSEPKVKDRDGDGILDPDDECPDRPEDKDGFQDEDGCPDLDNDEDGIIDVEDHCPRDPEDLDGFEDDDGCPDLDNDKDDVPDEADACPLDPEDRDGFEDEDGCPDPDNDEDGIVDLKDLCPNEPETRNGIADNDGCPDEESVRVVGDKIELDQKIHFWTNSDRIRGMSYPVLEKLAKFLLKHPEYVRIDIEGHADARGEEEFNLDLSRRRAKSILEFLAKRGLSRDRLHSEGFGSSQPLVEGDTEHIWFMNRRVEFVVTREKTVRVHPETGEPLGDAQDGGPAFGRDKKSEEAAP